MIQAPLGWLQVTPKGWPRRQTVGPAGNESERILEPHQETTRVLWIVPFSLSDTIEPQNPGCLLQTGDQAPMDGRATDKKSQYEISVPGQADMFVL